MDFELTEEQKLIRNTARQIAKERIAPRAAEIDETGEYPQDIFELFKEQGFLGLDLPAKYGGSGAGALAQALVIEEVCKYCHTSGMILICCTLGTRSIMISGSEEQKQYYASRIASGELRGAFGLTEPAAGSDPASMLTKAVRQGDDYILNGEKCFISGAAVADYFIVFAKTDPSAGARGVSVIIVPKDAPGFSVGKPDKKLGVTGMPTCPLIMEDCRVPVTNLVGREGGGFGTAMLSLNTQRAGPAARGLGLAEGALMYALEYTRNREAFGQKLCDLQAVQFMMADMVIQIEAARHMVYHAAWLIEQGKYTREYAGILSTAKAFATEMANKVAFDALQLLGGHGYMREHPLERHYRDARQLMLVEGTSQIQRVVISRALLDRAIVY